ncbi:hypothetical protein OHA10_19375 [Kribbella sp. NBC_00662]|uniref:hypothetical protein n=1 Tax=Kribbella sp. NBC_00662 TaxID=2975969 RepID=UPI00324836DB
MAADATPGNRTHDTTEDRTAGQVGGAAGDTAGHDTGDSIGPTQAAARAAFAAVEQTVRQLAPAAAGQVRDGLETVSSSDVLAALAELRVVQDQLAAWEPLLIGAARDRGASWTVIAPALGVASRQAAERRYLRLNPHATEPDGMTGEQRVQAARDRRAGDRAVTQWARDNAAMLRRLAAQITALDGLDPSTQEAADRLLHALGDTDTATLLAPLAEAGAKLEDSHPRLAGQVSDISTTTDQLRTEHTARPQ